MLLYVFILQQSCVFYPFIHSWKTYLRPAGAEVQKLWTIFCFEALMAVCADDEGTFPYPPPPSSFQSFLFSFSFLVSKMSHVGDEEKQSYSLR